MRRGVGRRLNARIYPGSNYRRYVDAGDPDGVADLFLGRGKRVRKIFRAL